MDTGESTLEALSLCNWDPRDAAALLALRLHLGAMVKPRYFLLEVESWDFCCASSNRNELVFQGNKVGFHEVKLPLSFMDQIVILT